MAADPNWFYSTLAQSTAALVGLSGGFIASQLIARRPEVTAERLALHEKSQALQRDWEEAAREAEAVARSARQTTQPPPPKQVIRALHGQAVCTRELTTEERDALPILNEMAQDMAAYYRTAAAEISEAVQGEDPDAASSSMEEMPGWIQEGALRKHQGPQVFLPEAELLDGLTLQAAFGRFSLRLVDDQRDAFLVDLQAFRRRALPHSVSLLIMVLVGLLGCGLVWPLTFLSASPGPSQPLMIGAFTVLASAVVALLVYEIAVLRSLARKPLSDD